MRVSRSEIIGYEFKQDARTVHVECANTEDEQVLKKENLLLKVQRNDGWLFCDECGKRIY